MYTEPLFSITLDASLPNFKNHINCTNPPFIIQISQTEKKTVLNILKTIPNLHYFDLSQYLISSKDI